MMCNLKMTIFFALKMTVFLLKEKILSFLTKWSLRRGNLETCFVIKNHV
jgi:hypothetical protein